jgi:hypothetical protein
MRKTRLSGAVLAALGFLATFIALPGTANAQYGPSGPPPSHGGGGYYAPAPPGSWGFVQRRGITVGFGGAIGIMSSASSDLTDCIDCEYQPAAGGFDVHLGLMLNPRLALMGEFFVMFQLIDEEFADFLVEPMFMAALQYWVAPQFWLKGGLGVASLQISGGGGPDDELDTGGVISGAIGFEVLQAPRFTIDINLRVTSAGYNGIDDKVSTGTVGAGINWF